MDHLTSLAAGSAPGSTPEEARGISQDSRFERATAPLRWVFRKTCPACAEGEPYEHLYAVTLLSSFLWVALFSLFISSLVTRWATTFGIPTVILGAAPYRAPNPRPTHARARRPPVQLYPCARRPAAGCLPR